MDDNCGEWVECMGVASGCGEQEAGVASGSGWNLWVWLVGVVVRRLYYLSLLLLYLFLQQHPYFLFIFYVFLSYIFNDINQQRANVMASMSCTIQIVGYYFCCTILYCGQGNVIWMPCIFLVYTESESVVTTRWGSLRLAPITCLCA